VELAELHGVVDSTQLEELRQVIASSELLVTQKSRLD